MMKGDVGHQNYSSEVQVVIRGAWKSFCLAYKLKIGDSIIVELARNGKIPVLKLTRKSLKSKQPETELEAQATSSLVQQPFFLAEITYYCCLKSRLAIQLGKFEYRLLNKLDMDLQKLRCRSRVS
ncbi:uncharacterized protein [Euphorbia lathyris]|uniref:uncharacterized protein isoform X1 n=1 Tax=Euphorbia lathyris TaxID=212925 RepID=UPI003313D30F